jgi:hypothetical protein
MFVAEASRNETIRDIVRSVAGQRRQPALVAIQRAIDRGELAATVDPAAVVDMIAGAVIYRYLVFGDPIEPAYARRIIDQALNGVTRA